MISKAPEQATGQLKRQKIFKIDPPNDMKSAWYWSLTVRTTAPLLVHNYVFIFMSHKLKAVYELGELYIIIIISPPLSFLFLMTLR